MLKQRTVRPIPLLVDEEALEADLARYKQLALDLGASMVELIPASWVVVDERVRLKCQVPLCHHYDDFADSARVAKEGRVHTLKTDEIVAKVESAAFADGYHLAVGFGCGSCRTSFCDSLLCQMLDSGMCRFAMKARPSMEAMGIDVFALATKVGWEIYPIYKGIDPESVPCALSVGIVFVS
jgi:predicted metal-binding protein